jgi:hypothetical protein
MNILQIPPDILGILRQYAGPRPSTKANYDTVLKQMRRKHFFKRIRKQMDRNHVAHWHNLRIEYIYLDSDQRRRLAELSFELLIQDLIVGGFDG